MKVNMTPNPLDVVTIHASQGDTEARQWEFELHNNGELIDTSEITEQLFFKAYKGGTEQILPENTSTPTTSPFKGDIKYPQGLLSDQEFTYRQSPTEEDGNAKITDIKGNTLVWNQLVPPLSAMSAQNGTLSVADNVATITSSSSVSYLGIATSGSVVVLPKGGHKYLLTVEVNSPKALSSCNLWYGNSITYIQRNISANTWTKVSTMASYGTPAGQYIQLRAYGSFEQGDTLQVRNWNYFDLTAMGLDSLTEDEFTSIFSLPYYAYNQGSLLSFNGNGIKTVGKNLCDNSTIITGYYTGQNLNQDTNYKTSALIPVFPNTTYIGTIFDKNGNALNRLVYTEWDSNGNYIQQSISATLTTSSNTAFVRVRNFSGQTPNILNDDFLYQLELGSTATDYEPYTSTTTDLPISTYFPTGMKSAGSVYDELTPTKAITRIGVVDLGSLEWGTNNTDTQNIKRMQTTALRNVISKPSSASAIANVVCANYTTVSANATYLKTVGLAIDSAGNVLIYDPNYNTLASTEAFKQAMTGVYLYYELATPTETSSTTASLVTENAEIPLSNNDGVLVGKCTEQLSENPGFIDAKIKLADADGECYSNKIQLHVERSPQ